jgi:hypothetical protein
MKTNKFSAIALGIVIIAAFYFNFTNIPTKIFAYDNWGYYMYLPNILIEGEIAPKSMEFLKAINEKYELTPTYYQLAQAENGTWVNRFFIGISFLLLPFFLIAHLIAQFTDYPADGYSAPYFYAIWIAAPVYFSLGMLLIRKMLLRYLPDLVSAISLLAIYFASNLFFFSSLGNPFPHIFVFTQYAFLVWVTIKWHESHKPVYARLIGFSVALLAISRMSEIITLFIPLLWGVYNWQTFKSKIQLIKKYKKQFYQLVLIAFITGLPQILYWYLSSGSIFFNSYNDPSSQLKLGNPRFFHVLFSYRKGWLLYSPLMVVALLGFIVMFKRQKEIFWGFFIVFCINLYLIASFTSLNAWGYRAFIQTYAYLVLPLGFTIQYLSKKSLFIKVPSLLLLLALMYFTNFQSRQIQFNVLHGYRVTKEYYWAVFMKKHASEEDKKLLLIERSHSGDDVLENESDYIKKVVAFEGFEESKNSSNYDTSIVYDGSYSYRMDENIVFGPTISLQYQDITDDYYAYLRPGVYVYPDYDLSEKDVFVVFHFQNNGKSYKYRGYNINDERFKVKRGQWNYITFDYLSPEIVSSKDQIKFYIWNRDKQKLYIDNMQLESFTRDL